MNTREGKVNVDVVNSAYDGDGVHTRRVSRDSVDIEHAHGAILIAVQPTAVQSFLENKDLNGNGLLSRFVFAHPPSMIGKRKLLGTEGMTFKVAKDFSERMFELCSEVMGQQRTFDCTPDAVLELDRYYQEVENQLIPGGYLTNLYEGWGARCAQKALRIAAALAAWEGNISIEAKNVRSGVAIMRYFTTQLLIESGYGGTLGEEAKAILDKIREKQMKTVCLKEVKNFTRGKSPFREVGLSDKDRANRYAQGMEELEEKQYIRTSATGQRRHLEPNTQYDVNPYIFATSEAQTAEVFQL